MLLLLADTSCGAGASSVMIGTGDGWGILLLLVVAYLIGKVDSYRFRRRSMGSLVLQLAICADARGMRQECCGFAVLLGRRKQHLVFAALTGSNLLDWQGRWFRLDRLGHFSYDK